MLENFVLPKFVNPNLAQTSWGQAELGSSTWNQENIMVCEIIFREVKTGWEFTWTRSSVTLTRTAVLPQVSGIEIWVEETSRRARLGLHLREREAHDSSSSRVEGTMRNWRVEGWSLKGLTTSVLSGLESLPADSPLPLLKSLMMTTCALSNDQAWWGFDNCHRGLCPKLSYLVSNDRTTK